MPAVEADPWPALIQARLAAMTPLVDPAPTDPRPVWALPASWREQLVGASGLPRTAEIGVHVRELVHNTTLLDASGELALNPASNHKLLTAIAALELLGPDYRFETRVMLDGDDLVLVGEGDPALQVEHVAQLARAVSEQIDLGSIRRIVLDDSQFSADRFAPGYDPGGPGFSYMAPSGALSLQWNTIEITAARGDHGVEVFIDPPCAEIVVEHAATLGRKTDLTVETRAEGDRTIVTVSGTLGRRAGIETIRRRVADPGRFTASVFARALGDAAKDLPIVRGHASREALALAEHRSAPLHEVLHSALKFSNNFTTEQVLRTLARRATGKPGDWSSGNAVLASFVAALRPGDDSIVFENASGYSRRGRISARALATLLAWSQRPGSRSAALVGALAVAGTDGTLRDRLRDAAGRVRAKTGTLAGANALSGIVLDASGTPSLAFSVLINGPVTGHAAHAVQDRVVRLLLDHA
jgi:D-alanyl-D-alanine carboxypeptidase/D-alanyl-D-alanine-endopeptidase (penicillin-binding protein 4)